MSVKTVSKLSSDDSIKSHTTHKPKKNYAQYSTSLSSTNI